ncbi:MAG: alpha/beta hydrolase [Candidatus Sericytochromatia bacterium]
MKIIKRIFAILLTFLIAVALGFGLNLLLEDNPMKVKWDDTVGTIQTDFSYADGEKNKFDLYLPTSKNKETYGLVVYLHAGGFTTGDKSDDASILKFFTSKGYVSAGINYTLRTDKNNASVLQMSNEIKEAVPKVVEKAKELGYPIDRMAIMGGSAGGTLALLYAYRDGKDAPVPIKFVFEQVGPPSFEPNDWYYIGTDSNAAAVWVELMSGVKTTSEMIENGTYKEALKPISAYEWIDDNSPPLLCGYGKLDKIVPFASTKPLQEALKKHNVKSDFFVFPHSGHALHRDKEVSKAMFEALENYLKTYLQ